MSDAEQSIGMEEQSPRQPNYDTTLKDIVKQNVREFIQVLLPGAEYEATVNVELIRATIRADKAFRMFYNGRHQILNIEFESGTDDEMEARLLVYNAILHRDHKLPVTSIIIYPFRTKTATSPYRIENGDGEIITFNFKILQLFLQEAKYFVENQVKCMYPLLPTMLGVNQSLIKQALDELANLYKEDQVMLAQQLIWMELLLERTDTISQIEKQNIRENLNMYESLWDDNPKVKQIKAKAEYEGLQQGLQQAHEQGLQSMHRAVLKVVKKRFPALEPEAEAMIAQIRTYDTLNLLLDQLLDAPDEKIARFVLRLPAA